MDKELETLFTSWKIGNCEIKNRIVMTSMGGTSLFGWMEINHFDKEAAKFLMDKAKNNVGLILPGIQPVYNPFLGQWLHRKKSMYKPLKEFMDEIHKYGAKMFIQLTAGFGRSFAVTEQMEMVYKNPVVRTMAKPFMDLSKICASASESTNVWSDKLPSREMTIKEIQQFVTSFGKTAKLLKDAGVDGVEIHAVHEGYLLDQFTLKYVNKRTDQYGGSFENRYRFPVEIVQEIKKTCGKDFPVSLRFSVLSKTKGCRQGALPGEEYTEVGRDLEEAKRAAKYLQDAGYDMLNCDNGTYDAWYWAHPPIYMPENCNLEDVAAIRDSVSIPLVCAGRMNPRVGAKAIEEHKIDAVGFARPFLADGAWVTKMMEGREQDIRPCICCHNGCFTMARYKGHPNVQDLHDSFHMACCAVNAETMQTNIHHIVKTKKPKTIAVIGGGIGGMEAARVLALRGHKPVIYEKSDHLGGVFVEAGQAQFKGKLRELLAWYKLQMQELNVEIHLNTEIKALSDVKADEYIVATGSTPRKLPVKGFDKTIEACEMLSGKEVGETVAVIGGGLTGCELAYELYLQGKKPFIVEMQDDLIKQKGVCMANSMYLREYFDWKKIPVYLNTKLKEVRDNEIVVVNLENKEEVLPCDSVVVSAGYISQPLAKEDKHVHLVGDCLKIGNLRSVIWRAYDVAMKI